MSLINRQDALVARLEPIYRARFQRGYLGQDGAGKRAKEKRLHAEEMMKAGYTKREAWESAEQCDQVAFRNVDHQAFVEGFAQ